MKRRIYVSLDDLLDTRLATLIRLDEQLAGEVIECGYRDRVSDRWQELGVDVDQDAYERLYADRDGETLAIARPTNAVLMIHEMTAELEKLAVNTPMVDGITLDVNLWPYRMSQQVIDEVLNAIRFNLSPTVSVDSVFFSPQELTPELIDRSWDGLLMYDFNGWLTHHHEALMNKRMPRVSFIAPTLFANKTPTEDEVTFDGMGAVSPFAALEISLTEYLMLQMVDARYFSLVDL